MQEKIETQPNTEDAIRKILKDCGFTVNEKHNSSNGIDIVALKEGHYFLIEVKPIIVEENSYRVRLDDNCICDFILSLTSNNNLIHWETKKSSNSKIIRFFEMLRHVD